MLSNDKSTSSDPRVIDSLDQLRGKIISNTGGWFPGKGAFSHGYSILEDLVGEKSYFQILILNATGKMVERRLADWLESLYGGLSWPDPRIWCNQIGALAGTARTSVVSATAIGCLAADSRTYGIFPLVEGLTFIQQALKSHRNGLSAEEIVEERVRANRGKPYIIGYIRPVANGDERIEVMEKIAQRLNFSIGPHLSLAYEIERALIEGYGERMNVNGYASAFLSDQGFTPQEVYQMCSTAVASGVTACYMDTFRRAPNTFLPLRCDDIDYQGVPRREVPD